MPRRNSLTEPELKTLETMVTDKITTTTNEAKTIDELGSLFRMRDKLIALNPGTKAPGKPASTPRKKKTDEAPATDA